MEQSVRRTIIRIVLTIVLILGTVSIATLAMIGFTELTSQQPTQFQQSEEYWNQVHVSEYLAEKTWNGNAQVIRAGLGRVIVNVDGKAYEYSCKGTFNCTEGFTNENVGNYYVGNGTE